MADVAGELYDNGAYATVAEGAVTTGPATRQGSVRYFRFSGITNANDTTELIHIPGAKYAIFTGVVGSNPSANETFEVRVQTPDGAIPEPGATPSGGSMVDPEEPLNGASLKWLIGSCSSAGVFTGSVLHNPPALFKIYKATNASGTFALYLEVHY